MLSYALIADDPARLEAVGLLGRLLRLAARELPKDSQPDWDALLVTVQQMGSQARKKGNTPCLRAVVNLTLTLTLILKKASLLTCGRWSIPSFSCSARPPSP